MEQLTQARISGDTKSMKSILIRSVSGDNRLPSIPEKVPYERNRKMTSGIEDFLRARENYFVIAGAGHLVGDRGIIEILKGKGYLFQK